MNKHVIITGIAIVVIIAPFAQSGLSILGMEQIQYRWDSPGEFNFFTMSNHGSIEFCNTMPFWISVKGIEIATFYDADHVGTFSINPVTLGPLSSSVHEGVFSSEAIATTQHLFMTLDFEFNGGDIRIDPSKHIVLVRADMPILGIIPYSTSTQMSGFDFDKMMNSENLTCD